MWLDGTLYYDCLVFTFSPKFATELLVLSLFFLLYQGSDWIDLIFVENENCNWKYCNKIIFKYVNSIVELIFNKKVTEKLNLWVCKQYTNALFTIDLVK